jgi:pyruvate/2-oxoglutarate dehydrogenase complex dihydrolipoamide dehydrogenase (E3) component
MQRMRKLRAGISHHDSAERFSGLGVDVFLGQASFSGPDTVDVAGKKLRFKRAVIATGARAAQLPIPGLSEAGVLTNESIFSLTELPPRLVVIGGGPIGSEMAQTFARFGSQVTLIEKAAHVLTREDADAAQIVQAAMIRDGVEIRLNTETVGLATEEDEKIVTVRRDGVEEAIRADQVLVGIGRQPNVDGLNLESVGVAYDNRAGVTVNDRLQTTNPKIYAAGDICSRFKFTHAADFMARIVIQNALFFGRRKASALTIPWCTYTSPELAHVGLTDKDAQQQDVAIDTFTQQMSGVDRAILDGETDGFVKIHVARGTDKIVGATIVAENAGDMIGSLSIAITNNIGLGTIANSIHPYPTQAEAIRKVGDLYNRTRLTPKVKSLFEKWLAWTR